MNIRKPAVAGRFYPGNPKVLSDLVDKLFASHAEKEAESPLAVMAPHAGYIFSAPVVAKTIGNTRLPKTVVIFCPNHTGLGKSRYGVWPDGYWETPLGSVKVNEDLAARICRHQPYQADTLCHVRDHAIEVQLPFLQRMGVDFDIVPVCVASRNLNNLRLAGEALAREAGAGILDGSIGIFVSSDMNHYESEAVTNEKDMEALDHVLKEDPAGLVNTCQEKRITMCGASPMAIGLYALKALRKEPRKMPRLMGHTTSGPVARNFEKVVGYAGVRLYA